MKIYEVAVLFVPPEKKNEDQTEKAQLLVKPTAILAKNDAAAQIQAARMIPEAFEDKLEQVQVAVRPF
jgi:hypothetical protein